MEPIGSKNKKSRVFLRRKNTGSDWRKWWFARWRDVDGRDREEKLCAWHGTPPTTPRGKGDDVFERSRVKAELMLEKVLASEETHKAADKIQMIQRLYELKYGAKQDEIPLASRKDNPLANSALSDAWQRLPANASSKDQRKRTVAVLDRFNDFMAEHYPRTKTVAAVTAEQFRDFLNSEAARGITPRTWNATLSFLRSSLLALRCESVGVMDYLAKVKKKEETPVNRDALSEAEIATVLEAAIADDAERAADEFEVFPLLFTAFATALRRGDVCTLKWECVKQDDHLPEIRTIAAKTGARVFIPISPRLAEVLEGQAKKAGGRRQGFVFPEVAAIYNESEAARSRLDSRLKRVFRRAGFSSSTDVVGTHPAAHDNADAIAKVAAGMTQAEWTEARKDKGLEILRAHLEGKSGKAIAQGLGISRASVSEYLHAMEEVGNVALVSAPVGARPMVADRHDGESRLHRGSKIGFHTARTSFIQAADNAGFPLSKLALITGHKLPGVIPKHYLPNPDKEVLRNLYLDKMPTILVGNRSTESSSIPAELARMLATASPKQLAKVKAVLANMLRKGGDK